MRTSVTALIGMLLMGLPLQAVAQPLGFPGYAEMDALNPDIEATAVTDPAPVFALPNPDSKFLERLARGDSVLVHEVAELEDGPYPMYGIATLEKGLVGYIHPHHVPDDVQRRMKDRTKKVYPPDADSFLQAVDSTHKSPGVATFLGGLFPGGGHLYAGETGRGLFLALSSGAALGIGIGFTNASSESSCTGFECLTQDYAFLMIGTVYYVGAWLHSVTDAGNAARRHNVLQRFAGASPVEVAPTVTTQGGRGAYGVTATLRF